MNFIHQWFTEKGYEKIAVLHMLLLHVAYSRQNTPRTDYLIYVLVTMSCIIHNLTTNSIKEHSLTTFIKFK